jgi:hypothetical protein
MPSRQAWWQWRAPGEGTDLRQFIRHPANIPIEISASADRDGQAVHGRHPGRDVSLGGLAFPCRSALAPGSLVSVRIRCVQPMFESVARVVWCRRIFLDYTVGAEFVDACDGFRVRMVEPVCHIESYRQQIYREAHRELSPDEAAMQWISKFGAQFPPSSSDDLR